MKIILVSPARPGTSHGNRVTALRWARILRSLGWGVRITTEYEGEPCDLLVALHARKSAAAVERFRRAFPDRRVVVALTGTDLYRDIRRSRRASRVLHLASRLIVLQPLGVRELPPRLRARTRVIHQSADPPPIVSRSRRTFDVCVIGHLRSEKDPFRAALATRKLPVESRIRILHVGRALSPAMERRARIEEERNSRYRWIGERRPREARKVLGRSHLMVLSSRMEGGANVISEALAAGVPILASRIPGSVGLLGPGYPGFFPVADTGALTRLLRRAETDERFLRGLEHACRRRAPITSHSREREAWRQLLEGLGWSVSRS